MSKRRQEPSTCLITWRTIDFLHNRDISFCEILCNFTLGNILNVAKWQSGKVANVSHFGEAMVADLGGKEKSATSCGEIADAERF